MYISLYTQQWRPEVGGMESQRPEKAIDRSGSVHGYNTTPTPMHTPTNLWHDTPMTAPTICTPRPWHAAMRCACAVSLGPPFHAHTHLYACGAHTTSLVPPLRCCMHACGAHAAIDHPSINHPEHTHSRTYPPTPTHPHLSMTPPMTVPTHLCVRRTT
jgi:hypothetical protein